LTNPLPILPPALSHTCSVGEYKKLPHHGLYHATYRPFYPYIFKAPQFIHFHGAADSVDIKSLFCYKKTQCLAAGAIKKPGKLFAPPDRKSGGICQGMQAMFIMGRKIVRKTGKRFTGKVITLH